MPCCAAHNGPQKNECSRPRQAFALSLPKWAYTCTTLTLCREVGEVSQQQAFDQLTRQLGEESFVSDWFEVTQDRINAFAEATGDHQWIHVDAERAARESPWGSTIAHGYLTLSLYPMLRGLVDERRPIYPGVKQAVNYGLGKLRFPQAVKAGSRIRARCTPLKVEEVGGGLQVLEQYVVEVEGESKPACVAEAIMRMYF
jgi:acyl dehydratase